MRIVIIRHGIAEDFGPDGSDASRRLTPEGVEKTGKVARGLLKIAKKPQAILASPKVRAHHTAQIIALEFGVKVQTVPVIQEEDPIALLAMAAGRSEDSIFIVGHEPTLGALVEFLISGRLSKGSTPMKKAGAACFEIAFGKDPSSFSSELKWFLPPDVLTLL